MSENVQSRVREWSTGETKDGLGRKDHIRLNKLVWFCEDISGFSI